MTAKLSAVTVASALRECGLPDREARILLAAILDVSQAWLLAHDRDELAGIEISAFAAFCARRKGGEPIAYVTGIREFYGLCFMVTPAVLIPRPETELLVDLALERIAESAPSQVLDLGTGSGAVALAIATHRPQAVLTAADISESALKIARANAAKLILTINLAAGDWYEAVADQRFDLIVANPPYIAHGDPHLGEGDLRFEPGGALCDGSDGLASIRKIVGGGGNHLAAGGWLLFEHGYDQATVCLELLTGAGFRDVQSWRDLAGIDRVSGGKWNAT